MKHVLTFVACAGLPLLAAGQGLPRYRAISLGPGYGMRSISPVGDALFTDDDAQSIIFGPSSGTHVFPSFVHALGLTSNGDAWCYDYQDKTYLYHRTSDTYTEYVNPFGGGLARLTGANASGRAVGQIDAITGLGTPVRWLTSTTGEILMDSSGTNVAAYVQAISDSGYALGSDGADNACIWAPGVATARVVRPENKRVSLNNMASNGWISASQSFDGGPSKDAYILSATGSILHTVSAYAGRSIYLSKVVGNGWASGVSYKYVGSSLDSRAIIWSPTTGVVELQSLVDGLPSGMALKGCQVSESGAVLAIGPVFNGLHAQIYYLEPVPEPMSIVPAGIGVATLLRRRRI